MESTKHPPTSTTLGSPSGELVLRITGNSTQPETVRVRTAKCSVGSADACSIRLNGAGIHPVHCIILRGAKETVVRRWADEVWLNGKAFTDANLRVGDVITISDVRLEVVSDERVASAGGLQEQVASAESRVEELSEQARLLNMRIRQLEGHHSTKFSDGAQDDLLLRLARLQDEKQELERRIAAQSVRHLDERRQWSCDLERLQAQVAKVEEFKLNKQAIRAEEEALRAEVASLRNQIRQQQADFEAQRSDWQRQAEAAAEEAATASDDVSRRLAELESRQSQFEDEARSFRNEQDATRQELEQRSQELDAAANELAAQTQRLEAQANALVEQAAELDARAAALAEKNEAAAATAVDRIEDDEQDAFVDHEANGGFSFPSQLGLKETEHWPTASEVEADSVTDHDSNVDHESTADAVADSDKAESESHHDESFEKLHAEISSLINDDEASTDASTTAADDESEDLASDDLMDYASQVASEVRGQVIDQQPAADKEVYEEDDHFVEDALTYSDAPFVDSSELTDEPDSPILNELHDIRKPADAAETPFAITEDSEFDHERSASPFDAEVDHVAERAAESSPFDEPAAEDEGPLHGFADELLRDIVDESDSNPNSDGASDQSSFDATAASEVEPTEREALTDHGAANEAEFSNAASTDEAPEHDAAADDIADEMLSRLQAMVGADGGPTSSPSSNSLAASGDAAFENRLDADAESLLSELQSFESEEQPTDQPMSAADEVALSARDDAMLAELMEPSSQDSATNDVPLTADEVQYETVEPADVDQLETASLLQKYQIEDAPPQIEDEAPVVVPAIQPPSANADGDSSIEDYMQQLMQRVGNGPGAVAKPTPQETEAIEAAEVAAQEAIELAEKAKPVRTPSRPSLPADSLTKMRELANESARSAIKSHADTNLRANAFTNLCFLGISLLAAAIFFVLSEGTSLIWLLPGLVASGAAILFGYRAVKGVVIERAAGAVERTRNVELAGAEAAAATAARLNQQGAATLAPSAQISPTIPQPMNDGTQPAGQQPGFETNASEYPSLLAHQPPAGQQQFAQPGYAQPQAAADPSQLAQPGYTMPGHEQQYGTNPPVAGQPQHPPAGYAMPQQPGQQAYDQSGQPIPQSAFPGIAQPQAQQPMDFGLAAPAQGIDPNAMAAGYPTPTAPPAHDPNSQSLLNSHDPLAAFGSQLTQPPQDHPG